MEASFSIDNSINYRKYIPLLTPAVKANSCEVDYDLLQTRLAIVALAAITTLVTSLLLAQVIPLAIIAVPLSMFSIIAVPLIDMGIAEKAADTKAVDEYLNKNYPSKSATFRIHFCFRAAQLLVNKKGDLNKSNENGEKLLSYCSNFDVFKLLINNGADIKCKNKYGKTLFEHYMSDKNPKYIEHILKTGKAKPADFSPDEQVKFWTTLGSAETGRVLKQYGFDVNIRDSKGYTPLLKMIKNDSEPNSRGFEFTFLRELGFGEHIRVLLDCGADTSLTVDVGGVQKNAMQINTNPVVDEIFDELT